MYRREHKRRLAEAGDVQEVSDAVEGVVIDHILGHDNEPDEEGIAIQKIREAIFYQNRDEEEEPR